MRSSLGLILGVCLMGPPAIFAQDNGNRTLQLPSVTVAATAVPGENIIVGTYGQPEWSARRPFPGISVYVVPAGEEEVELTYLEQPFLHANRRREFAQEFELGLPRRFQLALENSVQDFQEAPVAQAGWREDSIIGTLRYAVADWGKFPLNPALSVGWRRNRRTSDAWRLGLVIGDELTPRWHWAANIGVEHPLGSAGRREVTADGAITYSVLNETLNIGLQAGWRSHRGDLDPPATYAVGGPCIQYRPWDEFHLNAACLWSDRVSGAPIREFQISVGFEFGEGADDHDNEPKRGGNFDR